MRYILIANELTEDNVEVRFDKQTELSMYIYIYIS